MNTKNYYIEVPVSERLPDDDGYYIVKSTAGLTREWYNKARNYFGHNEQFKILATAWLEKKDIPVVGYSREQVGDAFDAGGDWRHYEDNKYDNAKWYPNKEKFLASIPAPSASFTAESVNERLSQ